MTKEETNALLDQARTILVDSKYETKIKETIEVLEDLKISTQNHRRGLSENETVEWRRFLMREEALDTAILNLKKGL